MFYSLQTLFFGSHGGFPIWSSILFSTRCFQFVVSVVCNVRMYLALPLLSLVSLFSAAMDLPPQSSGFSEVTGSNGTSWGSRAAAQSWDTYRMWGKPRVNLFDALLFWHTLAFECICKVVVRLFTRDQLSTPGG